MNLSRSRAAKAVVSVAALAVLIGPSAAGAWAQEETPAPEETTAPEATTTEAAPTGEEIHPLPEPKENRYHAGASLQIRVNADAKQNSDVINYRWSVNQVTVQAPETENGTTVTVPMPDRGNAIRYLNNFGRPSVENGIAMLEAPIENGVGLSRTVSLWPQDEDPKVSLTAKFWLDGVEQESAQDVVGKSGVLTAQYTVTNLSTANYDVTVEDLNGNPVTVTQPAQQLYVGIAKTLIPQRYAGLNTPGGMGGADGRANNQIQWIIVPTMPINENGVKTFGWSARVTDAVIPSMILQVQPVYHAAGHAEEEVPAEEAASAPIPLDPALATISAGVDQLVDGLDSLASQPESPCTLPDGTTSTDTLVCVSNGINNLISGIFGISNVGHTLSDLFNPAIDGSVTQTLNELENTLLTTGVISDAQWSKLNAVATVLTAGEGAVCQALAAAGAPIDPAGCYSSAQSLDAKLGEDYEAFRQSGADLAPEVGAAADQAELVFTNIDNFQAAVVSSEDLQGKIDQAKADFLAAGGSDVSAGLDTISAGVGQAKTIIAAYLSDVAAELQAAGADANAIIINLRAEIAALKAAMGTSPFPYGGDTTNLPEGTVLAGAYEFRIDAADTNHPYTLPRILLGLLALIGAGLVTKFLGDRHSA